EDIYCLCRALLERHGRPDLGVTFAFMTGLLHYDYPFNVRELEAIVKRGIALCEGTELDAPHLPDEIKDLMKHYGERGPAPGGPKSNAAPTAMQAAPPAAAPPHARPTVPTEQELRALLQ